MTVNPKNGSTTDIVYGKLEYELEDLDGAAEKVFNYTITETGSGSGVTNDSKTHTMAVTVKDNGDGTLKYIFMQVPLGVALYGEHFAPRYYALLEDISSYSEDDQAEIMFNMFRSGTAIPYQDIEELAPTEEDKMRYLWETYEAYLVQKEYEQYKLENPDKIIKTDEPVIGPH